MNGGTFTGNTAADGGAISEGTPAYADGQDGPQVNGATFDGNTAGSGGAIYDNSAGGAGLQVTDSTFTGNSAGTGGAIYDYSAFYDSVSGSFHGNTAETGGALFLDPGDSASVSGVVSGNSATGDGGGIVSFYGLQLGGTISDNHAGGLGGGLYISQGTGTTVGGDFSGNTAEEGGAIYNTVNFLPMNLGDVSISDNHASAYGGGLYNQGTVDALNAGITHNSAATGGGGIYDDGPYATVSLTTSTVLNNKPDKAAHRLDHGLHQCRARLYQRLGCHGGLRARIQVHGDRDRRPGAQDHQNRPAAIGRAVR